MVTALSVHPQPGRFTASGVFLSRSDTGWVVRREACGRAAVSRAEGTHAVAAATAVATAATVAAAAAPAATVTHGSGW